MAELETGSYITKIREGKRVRYRTNLDMCLESETNLFNYDFNQYVAGRAIAYLTSIPQSH